MSILSSRSAGKYTGKKYREQGESNAVAGQVSDFVFVKSHFAGGKIDLAQASALDVGPERRPGNVQDFHGFPGSDQSAPDDWLPANTEDAVRVVLRHGFIVCEKSCDQLKRTVFHICCTFPSAGWFGRALHIQSRKIKK